MPLAMMIPLSFATCVKILARRPRTTPPRLDVFEQHP